MCWSVRPFLSAVLLFAAPYATAEPVTEPSAPQTPPLADVIHHPNAGREGIVVAEERLAAVVGADILAAGGNAVDAAVAVGFALAVTYPRAGNLAGGGFMLVYDADTGETTAIDYRETAPAAASRDMFLDENGDIDVESILYTHKASATPGTVAGLLHAHEKFGALSRREVIAPAIRLAERGYALPYYSAAMFEASRGDLTRNAAARAEFFKPDGSGYLPGETYRRPDLARTLKAISRRGRDGFYKGWVARAIANDMAANDGLISLDDLANFTVKERTALRGAYRGVEIVTMPPPSSGGVHLIEMLNMIETRPPYESDGESAAQAHFLVEVMRRAYADRAQLLGDPDFVSVPTSELTSKGYAAARIADFDPARATPSEALYDGFAPSDESPDTTHFSVIDRDGNMVANTYTLNLSYGSGVVIPGTGLLMNNEMDDFAAAPGQPNFYGLVGNERNAIAPGKRPLSSMTPALLFKEGEPWMALGAPGGARIITAVLNVALNVIDRDMNIADAVDEPRVHHQWLPDHILYEPGLSEDTKALLEAKGHKLEPFDWFARPNAALVEDGWYFGFDDERMPGGAACSPDGGC
ncbi:MAG: gamma-glutamyltransferase [Pseudomonadota bacterium]